MRATIPKKAKPGDVLTARMWNDLIDLITRCDLNAGQGSGIELLETTSGKIIKAKDRPNRYLAIANGNIPARSGSAAGIGSVTLVFATPTYTSGALTAVSLETSSINFDVYNSSSNTMTSGNGIDSGMYCWIEEYPSGLFSVAPLECS